MPSDSIDIITTGRPDLTAYAEKYGWLTGARTDNLTEYERAGQPVDFIDLHWEDPDRDALLAGVKEHRPKYVVAGDYDGENYESVNQFGDRLRRWAENVIIVPHDPGEVEHVPDWAVVGYSTPTGYNGTDAPVWEYYGRDVHVLGGTMNQIELVAASLRNDIVSIDTNTMHRDATQYGEYWTPTKPQRKKPPTVVPMIEKAYENSVVNMTYALESWGML